MCTYVVVYMCVCVCVCAACVLSHFSCVRLFVIPWTGGHQPSMSVGFSWQEYWSGLPFPPPRDRPNPGIKPVSPGLAGRFFTTEPPGKPIYTYTPPFCVSFPFRTPGGPVIKTRHVFKHLMVGIRMIFQLVIVLWVKGEPGSDRAGGC